MESENPVDWFRNDELDVARAIFLPGSISALRREAGVKVLAGPSAGYQGFNFRIGPGGHPALRNKLIRRALAHGIDRAGLVREVPGQIDPNLRPLQSILFLVQSPYYRPHWSRYRYRPALATRLLECLAGRMVLTGHHDGTVQVWSTTSWKPVGRLIEAHEGKRVRWMGFAHGGATLATAGQDGSIELTDMKTRSAVGSPLSVKPQDFVAAALSPDGRHLFALATNRVALRWDLSVQAWKQQACRVAGRELTRREWGDDALPGAPYRTVCRPG